MAPKAAKASTAIVAVAGIFAGVLQQTSLV
jgi:hypothetical protein